MKLYNETVRSTISELDSSRPFLLSSPTNGIESEKEGGVAQNPGDELFGDIHFYNEHANLWADNTYMVPRCSSEYGVQSFPRKETMLKWLNGTDWGYTSEQMKRRQHHPGGYYAQLAMIFSHFKIPSECGGVIDAECKYVKKPAFMDRFVYLSQFHQAITYQVQTEHYRRWRGRLDQYGKGHTMCALYWQLNDLWAAPTWSTIDYELSWKPAHYFARRFFAPVILSMYLSETRLLQMFVVSDLVEPIFNATVVLEMFSWFDSFTPIYSVNKTITIPPEISTEIVMDQATKHMLRDKNSATYVLRGKILSRNGAQIGYDAVYLPDKLFKVAEENFGSAWVEKLKKINDSSYELEIRAEKIAPLVYMELPLGLYGWFSDNAFMMTEPRRTVTLTLLRIPTFQLSKQDIAICSLRNCGMLNNATFGSN
ncbi:unnamed protein product [Gongylonema pulchrum]|uniref:Beta-mannosidase n=1 Tax=Gongylonema pulchrum TaxID=637853 RepID=A0A183CY83_9BILA|nr:unnamed protein product [Gongylonema pulchrum]